MKKILILFLMCLMQFPAYGQLNTFQEGDVLSADKMNENFQHLEQQFRGARSIKVDCAAGEKINDAIENGFSDINVSGTCTENLLYEVWPLIVNDGDPNFRDNTKLAPRYLKITGADSTAKIQDATSQAKSTIYMNSGTTLLLDNITISGGLYGISVTRNSNLLMSGVTIENFNEMGVRLSDNAWLGVDDGGIIVNGDGSGSGIVLGSGPTAWIHRFSISGVQIGLEAGAGSTVLTGGYTISASDVGLRIIDSQFLQYGGSGRDGKITGTSGAAVWVFQGIFNVWDPGALELHDLVDGQGIYFNQSKGTLNKLTMRDFIRTGTDWSKRAIHIHNSDLELNNAEISGTTDDSLIVVEDGSFAHLTNLSLSGSSSNREIFGLFRNSSLRLHDSNLDANSGVRGLSVLQDSRLDLRNTTIAGTLTGSVITIGQSSSAEVRDATIQSQGAGNAIGLSTSNLELQDSTVDGTGSESLIFIGNGSTAMIRDSNFTATSEIGFDVGEGILNFRNSTLTASNLGMRLKQNTYATIWEGSSIATSNKPAIELSKGGGLKIRGGVSLTSDLNKTMIIEQASWASIDNEEEITIQSKNSVPDIEVSSMSYLNVEGSHQIGQVICSERSFVAAVEGAVLNLDPNCTEDGNSGTTNNAHVGSLSDLQGTWITSCWNNDGEYETRGIEISGTTLVFKWTRYSDSACENPKGRLQSSFTNLSVGNRVTFTNGSSGYQFSMTWDNQTATPFEEDTLQYMLDVSYCGISTWELATPGNITGKDCGEDGIFPPKNAVMYNAYLLTENNLFLGEGSNDGTYPTAVITDQLYVKQ